MNNKNDVINFVKTGLSGYVISNNYALPPDDIIDADFIKDTYEYLTNHNITKNELDVINLLNTFYYDLVDATKSILNYMYLLKNFGSKLTKEDIEIQFSLVQIISAYDNHSKEIFLRVSNVFLNKRILKELRKSSKISQIDITSIFYSALDAIEMYKHNLADDIYFIKVIQSFQYSPTFTIPNCDNIMETYNGMLSQYMDFLTQGNINPNYDLVMKRFVYLMQNNIEITETDGLLNIINSNRTFHEKMDYLESVCNTAYVKSFYGNNFQK
jgi:hypothetical protein